MVISFASGKGGTGKTTLATNFALVLADTGRHNIQFLDCDVEEPNAAIFLKPNITTHESIGIPIPVVDFKKCTYCGTCARICAYNAIAVVNPVQYRKSEKGMDKSTVSHNSSNKLKNNVLIFPELCHGCGGCTLLCPEDAISETPREIGKIETGTVGMMEFVQGRLNIGEPMATPLIREMKKRPSPSPLKKEDGGGECNQITIRDVPPGTSCPVIEAVKGSDFVLLTTEPTPFGLNDLILAVDTIRALALPFGVVINRDGIGDNGIDNYCKNEKIPVLMRIPMDREIAVAYSQGIPMIQINDEYKRKFNKLYDTIVEQIRLLS